MSIILNDNLKINAGKPVDSRYLSSGNTAYVSTGATNNAIPISERYIGLTVNIGGNEYWYKDGVADIDLELKSITGGTFGNALTGITNIGFFSGTTAIQTLPIDHLTDNNFDGNYNSLYNFYFRDSSGFIRVGIPSDNIPKRGYVKTAFPIKSFIWNEFTGAGNQVGWILIDGDIDEQIGTFQIGVAYYPPISAYTNTSWIQGNAYNNASNLVVNAVIGNLTSGTTLTVGGPVYSKTVDSVAELRTLKSKTPDIIDISFDETFFYVSGTTGIMDGENIGTGAGVFASKLNNNLQFRRLLGVGDTQVTLSGDTVLINSDSTGGGVYNGESPAAITLGGILSGTTLTGKTANEILEELLVPVLFPSFTIPSNTFTKSSPSGTLFEVGYVGNFNFSAGFNRGTINPAYTTSGFRSGLPTTYNYTGTGLPSTFSSSALSDTQTSTGYTILIGNQSWSGSVTFLGGEQPKDSKGNDYDSPYPSGTTSSITRTVEGVHPLFGTTTSITGVTKQTLVSMLTGNNVVFSMVAETGGNKQKFDIPDTWTGAPTNRPLVGIQTFNTVSSVWEYQGGNAANSLTFWDTSATTHTIDGVINYTRYTYNSSDRSSVQIRLVF